MGFFDEISTNFSSQELTIIRNVGKTITYAGIFGIGCFCVATHIPMKTTLIRGRIVSFGKIGVVWKTPYVQVRVTSTHDIIKSFDVPLSMGLQNFEVAKEYDFIARQYMAIFPWRGESGDILITFDNDNIGAQQK
jgi:hypothetical protein